VFLPLLNTVNRTTTDSETAAVLCDCFSSTFLHEKVPVDINTTHYDRLSITITTDHVLKSLLNIQPDKSPGPHNVHPMFLRETAQIIAEPLAMIFRKSLEGEVPDDWKVANVTPIYKKGSKLCTENYRPISLTICVYKILESIIKHQMTSFLDSNSIITNKQPARSF